MRIKRFNESLDDKVVIKDEFLEDITNYIDSKINNQLVSLGLLAKTFSEVFKELIATKEDFNEDNEKLSILHYNIKGKNIDIKFPTKKLISADDYEIYQTANKYNI